MSNQLNKLLLVKPAESYPYVIQDEVDKFTFSKHHPAQNFGSYVFRMQQFAGDLDLTEEVIYSSEKATISTFIRKLKLIVRNLDKNHIFSEFKAGFDHNYIFPIGELNNGIYTPNKDIEENLIQRYELNLFTDEEYNTIKKALNIIKKSRDTTIHEMAFDYIYNTIRNRYVLRWTKEEILDSQKILSDGSKYTLATALKDDTIVKIDILSLINNKYVEVTNIISLEYVENKEIKPINIDINIIHHGIDSLTEDIEGLYYSNSAYSPFKACKRIYSVMRKLKSYDGLVKRLSPIIRGEISLLYQIKSELDAILVVLNISPTTYHVEHANLQLQDIKGRLNYVLDITNDGIKNFSEEIDQITDNGRLSEKIDQIKYLNGDIKIIIQYLTIDKMNKYQFNPIPATFLPTKRNYDRSKIRKPADNPLQVYKDFVNSFKQ